MPIVVSLTRATGTSSKRNFHRPESNCGMPLNSGCRVFIVLQPRLRLQVRARRQSTGSVPQTRRKCSKLSFQESDFYSCTFLKRLKMDISRSVKSPPRLLGSAPGRSFRVVRHFSLFGDDFRPSGPPPDGLAVVSSDSALSCDHALPFITTPVTDLVR